MIRPQNKFKIIMTKEEINTLSQKIEDVSCYFENKPWTANVKLLKEEFNVESINTPNYYWEIIDEIEEVLRETRILFLCSVFNIICKEEGKLYYFKTPYQSNMRYDAIMKKEGSFYLLDEDGHYRVNAISNVSTRLLDMGNLPVGL